MKPRDVNGGQGVERPSRSRDALIAIAGFSERAKQLLLKLPATQQAEQGAVASGPCHSGTEPSRVVGRKASVVKKRSEPSITCAVTPSPGNSTRTSDNRSSGSGLNEKEPQQQQQVSSNQQDAGAYRSATKTAAGQYGKHPIKTCKGSQAEMCQNVVPDRADVVSGVASVGGDLTPEQNHTPHGDEHSLNSAQFTLQPVPPLRMSTPSISLPQGNSSGRLSRFSNHDGLALLHNPLDSPADAAGGCGGCGSNGYVRCVTSPRQVSNILFPGVASPRPAPVGAQPGPHSCHPSPTATAAGRQSIPAHRMSSPQLVHHAPFRRATCEEYTVFPVHNSFLSQAQQRSKTAAHASCGFETFCVSGDFVGDHHSYSGHGPEGNANSDHVAFGRHSSYGGVVVNNMGLRKSQNNAVMLFPHYSRSGRLLRLLDEQVAAAAAAEQAPGDGYKWSSTTTTTTTATKLVLHSSQPNSPIGVAPQTAWPHPASISFNNMPGRHSSGAVTTSSRSTNSHQCFFTAAHHHVPSPSYTSTCARAVDESHDQHAASHTMASWHQQHQHETPQQPALRNCVSQDGYSCHGTHTPAAAPVYSFTPDMHQHYGAATAHATSYDDARRNSSTRYSTTEGAPSDATNNNNRHVVVPCRGSSSCSQVTETADMSSPTGRAPPPPRVMSPSSAAVAARVMSKVHEQLVAGLAGPKITGKRNIFQAGMRPSQGGHF